MSDILERIEYEIVFGEYTELESLLEELRDEIIRLREDAASNAAIAVNSQHEALLIVRQKEKEINILWEEVERHKTLIEALSKRIANDTAILEGHKEVTKELAEWSLKYPKSRIMSSSIRAKCEDELAEIELMAIALQESKK